VLLAATEHRRKLFAAPEPGAQAPGLAPLAAAPVPVPEPLPVAESPRSPASVAEPSPGTPAKGPEAPDVPAVPAFESDLPRAAAANAPAAIPADASGEDAVARRLIAVEARLGRGQLEGAVVDLLELAREHPADPRVRARLVRVLHQRALLHYGDGHVGDAIADWQRVLELDPLHRAARRLFETAAAEHH
jgi:hypothetical protein